MKGKSRKNKIKDKTVAVVIAVAISIAAFTGFLYSTNLITNALLLVAISIAILFPFRKTISVVKYYLLCVAVVLLGWVLSGLGSTLFPFLFAIITGYLLNPIVSKLEAKGMPRWASAAIVLVIFCTVLALIGIFIFPIIFNQVETIAGRVSDYVSAVPEYLQSGKLNRLIGRLGIPDETIRTTITHEILPRIEKIISVLFDSLLKILLSFSTLATQVVNLVITPFLMFYFLKDFGKIKSKVGWILRKENKKLYRYLSRFDEVLRIYIGWQIMASVIVTTLASISFSIFSIPYGILLACIAGLLNPIPYFGSIFSMIISACVLILIGSGNFVFDIAVVVCTIVGIHFINAYILEPNIAGERVGVHPVLMILSVFVFSSLFGIGGMLVAVPITAVLVTVAQDAFHEHYRKLDTAPEDAGGAE